MLEKDLVPFLCKSSLFFFSKSFALSSSSELSSELSLSVSVRLSDALQQHNDENSEQD